MLYTGGWPHPSMYLLNILRSYQMSICGGSEWISAIQGIYRVNGINRRGRCYIIDFPNTMMKGEERVQAYTPIYLITFFMTVAI
jgi:hypothetical protein